MPDAIQQQLAHTLEASRRETRESSVGMLFWLAQAGQIISPWWSKRRDSQLRTMARDSDHFSGAEFMIGSKLTSVPFRVEPRTSGVKAHIKAADHFQSWLDEMPQYGEGWAAFWGLFLEDLWQTDNGAFGHIIGAGDPLGPIKGPPLGLIHLDSFNCQRSSNPEFPVIYTDASGDGKRYKLHHTRVLHASQMSSAVAEMNGVGFCWLSRAVNVAQNLIDIAVYKQEKLGSRPLRGIITADGASTETLIEAIGMSEEGMDNQGLSRFAKMAVIGSTGPPVNLTITDLASLPDGFSERESTELAMNVIALAGGFPPRWLWPATATGATKADAMYQHIAGAGGGMTWHLSMIQRLLGGSPRGTRSMVGKLLPPYLKLVFDYQDDEQDRLQADIRRTRADTRAKNLESQVTDVRVERQNMVSAGDMTPAQFAELELEDGRLPDGSDVLSLFFSADERTQELLDLGVEDPLLIDANDPIDMLVEIEAAALVANEAVVTAGTEGAKRSATQALAALSKLKDAYAQIALETIVSEAEAEEGGTPEGEQQEEQAEGQPPQEQEEGAPQETEENLTEEEEKELAAILQHCIDTATEFVTLDEMQKEFNFGAKLGERIRGSLFRGAGGKFASEAEVQQRQAEFIAKLIGKLRDRRAAGKGGKKRAAKKPKAPKGGAGGKKKKTPEEIAREKRRALNKNLNKTFQAVADKTGIDRDGMRALEGFALDGKALGAEDAQKYAAVGLVQFDTDGEPQMTAAGKSLMSAAGKGDTRKASEAVARGKAAVKKTQERAAKKREAAAKAEGNAAELESDADGAVADGKKRADEIRGKADESAKEAEGKANDIIAAADEQIESIANRLNNPERFPMTGTQREAAEKKIETLRSDASERAKTIREQAGATRQAADERAAEAERKATERAERIRERAGKQRERAVELSADADEIETVFTGPPQEKSIYNLASPLICGRTKFKQDEDEPPRGDFEDQMADALQQAFAEARQETLSALDQGEQPDYDELRQRIIAIMVPLLANAALFSFEQGEEQFQLFFDDGETADQATAWAQEHAALLATQLINTTQKIADRGAEQVDEGASEEEVEATIDRAFNESRQERIGTTETTIALAIGWLLYQRRAAQDNVEIELIWFTREDERVCPVCAPLHGTKQEEWSQQFPDGPPAHVKCRCGILARRKRGRK